MGFNSKQFDLIFPKAQPGFGVAFFQSCPQFNIDSDQRLAAFFAQISHESLGLTRLEESFRYSPERLMVVWPSQFRTIEDANRVAALGPHGIASFVYRSRMGNGDIASGDGWTYRGR